jgi:Icc-related predicted phosphoesterase
MLKICAISDVHGRHDSVVVPECDLLISAGDYSFRGQDQEVKSFHEWLNKQPAKYIISVQGNHELGVQANFQWAKRIAEEACPRVIFIEEGLVEIEGINIWCSSTTPYFHNWAYNKFRGDEIKESWDRIPNDIKVLVTHGPPYGILDSTPSGEKVGCEELWKRIVQIPTLQMHIFGHIHCSYGEYHFNGVSYYNVSICDERYKAVNKPVVVEI